MRKFDFDLFDFYVRHPTLALIFLVAWISSFYFFDPSSQSWRFLTTTPGGNLTLNLISEIVGILVTVVWIDRLTRMREERRWKPVKDIVYGQLMRLTGDLYRFVLPQEFKKRSGLVYYFGSTPALVTVDVVFDAFIQSEIDSLMKSCIEMLNSIKQDQLKAQKFQSYFFRREDVRSFPSLNLVKEIDEILKATPNLIEPEILGLLLSIKIEMEIISENVWLIDSKVNNLALKYCGIAIYTKRLQNELRTKSDRIDTIEQFETQTRTSRPNKEIVQKRIPRNNIARRSGKSRY